MDTENLTRVPHAQAKVSQTAYRATAQNRRITAAQVRELNGGISDMTLWRWMHRDDLKFPRPVYIGRRRYWKEAEIIAWLESQSQTAV